MKIIISLGGGGMKGYIPTFLLKEIEKRSGYKTYQFADIIGGTSIGGIVASLLCIKKTALESLELFTRYGRKIFKKRFLFFLRCPRYKEDGINSVLNEIFKDLKLRDISKKLLLTSYDITNKQPFFFKSYDKKTENYLIKDAARATSSAETFFPWQVIDNNAFSDGGTVQNNPSSIIYNDYCKLFRDKDVYLIYLGCGADNSKFENAYKYKNSWFIRNLMLVIESLFSGASEENVDYEMQTRMGKRYICLNPQLKYSVSLDGTSKEDVNNLQKNAESAINQFNKEIDFIVSLIKKKMSKS